MRISQIERLAPAVICAISVPNPKWSSRWTQTSASGPPWWGVCYPVANETALLQRHRPVDAVAVDR